MKLKRIGRPWIEANEFVNRRDLIVKTKKRGIFLLFLFLLPSVGEGEDEGVPYYITRSSCLSGVALAKSGACRRT